MARRILLIDDDPRIHALVNAQFDHREYKVISAYDGVFGLAAARERKPDIILLDVDMPRTQGFEVCRQLKLASATREIPVIFLTGSVALEATIFGLECGASDYLTKPFRPAELQARVRATLRNSVEIDRVERANGDFDSARSNSARPANSKLMNAEVEHA
jgi:DNA-binding response OmpR family regulator